MLAKKILLCCALLALMAPAGTSLAGGSDYTLGEVVMSADNPPVSEKVGTVRVITAEDIEKTGAKTLDEALALMPGLNMRTSNEAVPRIDVRGLRTRQVILLLNGVPMNSTYDDQFDPSFIPVENISRIKVTYGGSSVLYGAGGSAAVINVITKKGGEPGGHVQAGFDSDGAKYGRASVGGSKDKFSIMISGSHYARESFSLSDDFEASDPLMEDGGRRENSAKKRNNMALNYTLNPIEQTEFGLSLHMHQGSYGKPQSTRRDEFTSSRPNAYNRFNYRRMEDTEGFTIQGGASHEFDIPLTLKLSAYMNKLSEYEAGYDDYTYSSQTDVRNSFDSHTDTLCLGQMFQAEYDFDNFGTLAASLSNKRSQWSNKYTTRPEDTARKVTTSLDRHIGERSAALEYNIEPLDGLGLTAGAGTHYQYRPSGDDRNGDSYLLGAYYDIFEPTRIKASWSQKIRFPSIKQLYEVGKGDPDLAPENVEHIEFGVEQRIDAIDTRIDLAAFHTDTRNFIEKDDTTGINENMEEYVFQGVEAVVTNNSVKGLTLAAALTYMESENESEDRVFDEIQYRPEIKFTFTADYVAPADLIKDLTAHASWMYMDEREYFNKPMTEKDTLNEYNLVDLRLTKGFLDNTAKVYLGVDNLFDQYYEGGYGQPGPGRLIYAGASYDF